MNLEIEKACEIRFKWSKRIIDWEKEHGRDFCWRKNRTPYNIFIAEIILKRTTAKAAQRVYKKFLNTYPDIKSLAEADEGNIEKILLPVGLYKQRASQLKTAAEYILKNLNSDLPPEYSELIKVPGVGDYTASSIMVYVYGIKKAAVDSNVERIIGRAFTVKGKVLNNIAEILTPNSRPDIYNYGMLDLGALVCHYKYPKCKICPVNHYCRYYTSEISAEGLNEN